MLRRVFKAFQYRDFRLLWFGACTSSIGTWMQLVAQAWLIYRLSDSAVYLGLDTFCGQIPIFLFSLFGGVYADRKSRRNILIVSQFVQMTCAFTLAVLIPVIGALIACAAVAAYVLYIAAGTGLRLAAGLMSGGVLVPSLIGIGLIFGVVGIGTLIALALDSGLRLLGRHVRLNYQLLRMPAAGGGDED